MNHVNYFNDLFGSKPDYRKSVLLLFLNENDVNLSQEGGFLKSDIMRLFLGFKKYY